MATKKNLLEMVQNILSKLGDDEVNSISDTIRSYDVALVVEDTYYDLVLADVIPEHWELIQLEALSDTSRPTLMKVPEDVIEFKDVRYNTKKLTDTRDRFVSQTYVSPEEFLNRSLSINNDVSESETFTYTLPNNDLTELSGYNDKAPSYYTIFDNNTLVFDSFDSTVDGALQNRKSLAYASRIEDFLIEDTYTPDLDLTLNHYLYSMSMVNAFSTFKGYVPQVIARNASKLKRRIHNSKEKLSQDETYTAFGRARP